MSRKLLTLGRAIFPPWRGTAISRLSDQDLFDICVRRRVDFRIGFAHVFIEVYPDEFADYLRPFGRVADVVSLRNFAIEKATCYRHGAERF